MSNKRFIQGTGTIVPLLLTLLFIAGCAAPDHQKVLTPPPDNLQITIMDGAEQDGKSIMFRIDETQAAEEDEVLPGGEIESVTSVETNVEDQVQAGTDQMDSSDMLVFDMDEITSETQEPEEELPFEKSAFVGYEPDVSVQLGYRRDELNFSIAGPDGIPDIISELQWKDLEIAELIAEFHWSNDSNVYLRGLAGIGWTMAGNSQDSDYLGDNRMQEFSRSTSDAKGGGTLDMDFGLGYRFSVPLWETGKLHLMPLIGYSYHAQDLEMTSGLQALSEYGFPVPIGPFEDLDSEYSTDWRGPWFGFDAEFVISASHKLRGSYGYHWIDFNAEADWNLRPDFQHPKSFDHNADGDGYILGLSWQYQASPAWLWNLNGRYKKFSTSPGAMTFYFADQTEFQTRLNEVEWESYSLSIGLGYSF